jgi:hypothetical protein
MRADPVPTAPDFAGVLTDERYQQFLDECPGRRASFEKRTPKQQAEDRARIARLFALRASAMAADLAAFADLAEQLHATGRRIAAHYSPGEAARAFEAAGLPVPAAAEVVACDGTALDEPRALVIRLNAALRAFMADIDTEAKYILQRDERRAA